MKKIITKHRQAIVKTVCCLYMLLFVYTALSKLLDFENFRIQLAQSPLLSAYAGIIAPFVIIAELLLVLLLCFKTTRLTGLYASFFLMIAFTVYIYLILNYSDFIPCSCGGIIEKLGWTEHMLFNIAFALLALVAVALTEKEKGTRTSIVILRSVLPSLVAVGIVTGLFLSSEHIIKKENNFIRRFGQHPIRDEKTFDLGVDSYYFAGVAGDRIYLGNVTAPLVITSLDTALTTQRSFKIRLDNTGHQFRSIQVKVQPPWYYVYDGNVPVIYRGQLGDSFACTVSYEDCFFSQLQVIDSTDFAIRAQSSKTKTLVLGRLSLHREPKVALSDSLLEKQIDGVFDSDGQLLRDAVSGELIYIYTYRNEFLVMDDELTLLRKLHTIDTITRAQVKVHTLSDGQHKMVAPPLQVNKKSAVHGRVLFNESNLMGKFESREMWQQAAVIDMYRTDEQEYLGSFYIYHRGKNRMSRMFVTDRHLYVLSGSEIVRYRFAQAVTSHFKTGEAENLKQSR
ncbi:MAG TPA: MauE/DoxX family redox-associated membrane protein [Bacteroidales bacterium]|nr:MauE/DoxX family redox-associated membrane protein [Bacteroidales bacterium]